MRSGLGFLLQDVGFGVKHAWFRDQGFWFRVFGSDVVQAVAQGVPPSTIPDAVDDASFCMCAQTKYREPKKTQTSNHNPQTTTQNPQPTDY
jgi:hypothetical protein